MERDCGAGSGRTFLLFPTPIQVLGTLANVAAAGFAELVLSPAAAPEALSVLVDALQVRWAPGIMGEGSAALI